MSLFPLFLTDIHDLRPNYPEVEQEDGPEPELPQLQLGINSPFTPTPRHIPNCDSDSTHFNGLFNEYDNPISLQIPSLAFSSPYIHSQKSETVEKMKRHSEITQPEKSQSSSNNNPCTICFETMDKSFLSTTQCGHVFHRSWYFFYSINSSLQKWTAPKQKSGKIPCCPNCKTQISQVIDLFCSFHQRIPLITSIQNLQQKYQTLKGKYSRRGSSYISQRKKLSKLEAENAKLRTRLKKAESELSDYKSSISQKALERANCAVRYKFKDIQPSFLARLE